MVAGLSRDEEDWLRWESPDELLVVGTFSLPEDIHVRFKFSPVHIIK